MPRNFLIHPTPRAIHSMLHRLLASALVLALAPAALAEDAVAPAGATPPPAEPTGPKLSIAASADIVSAYYFRGYEQQDAGLILQPGATLTLSPLVESKDFTLGAFAGGWASIHSEGALFDDDDTYYEQDLFGGVTGALGPVNYTLTYTAYLYPADSFDPIHELSLSVNHAFTLSDELVLTPYATLAVEVEDHNPGARNNTYLELGATLAIATGTPVSVSVPLVVGLSVDDYYVSATDGDNELFGYASLGGVASYGFYDKDGVTASVYGGLYLYILNDDVAFLTDTGSDSALVAKVGVSVGF